jgi:hypothetical protein
MKYILDLEMTICGRVVVRAKNKEEAEYIGEKIMDDINYPNWFENGIELVDKIKKVSTKKDKKLIKEESLPLITKKYE